VTGSGISSRIPKVPPIVGYQNALNKEKKTISPFLQMGPTLDDKEKIIVNA